MKSVKGTETEKNLLKALAGESQARNRYTYFASRARKDGFVQIADIFEETANQEKEHAERFFKFLEGGELEITDLNRLYLDADRLKVQLLGRGFAWLDTGTVESLMDAAVFVQTVQNRQDVIISAPEEVAYHMGWLTKAQLLAAAARYDHSPYGTHLRAVAEDKLVFERELHD